MYSGKNSAFACRKPSKINLTKIPDGSAPSCWQAQVSQANFGSMRGKRSKRPRMQRQSVGGKEVLPPPPLSEILVEALNKRGLHGHALHIRLLTTWREVVGPMMGARTVPGQIYRGVLWIHAASSAWQHQLNFRKKHIVAEINAALGEELIQDLRIVAGTLPSPKQDKTPPAPHADIRIEAPWTPPPAKKPKIVEEKEEEDPALAIQDIPHKT